MRSRTRPTDALRFAVNLRRAVDDVSHEHADSAGLVHYWDTDALYATAGGVTAIADPSKEDRSALIVQALVSAGHISGLHMVSSHRNEFLTALTRWRQRSSRDASTYWDRVRRLVDESEALHEVAALLPDLSSASAAPRVQEQAALRDAVRQLTRLPPLALAELDLLAPHWPRRVKRMLSGDPVRLHLAGRREEPELGDVVGTELFAHTFTLLREMRDQRRSINNGSDAAALVAVAQMLERARDLDGAHALPRFYTESTSIARAVRTDPSIRDALSYRFRFGKASSERQDTVLRDSHYYLLRSFFPALRVGRHSVDINSAAFKELHDLAVDLDAALALDRPDHSLDERELQHIVNDYTIGRDDQGDPVSLAEVIADLEGYGMAGLWLAQDIDALVRRNVIDGLDELQRLGGRSDVTAVADELLHEHRVSEQEIDQLQSIVRIAQRVGELGERTRFEPFTLAYDFGAVKWGFPIGREDLDQLEITDASRRQIQRRLWEAVDVGTSDPRELHWAMALLFGLELYTDVEVAYKEYAGAGDTARPPGAQLLYLAARLHTGSGSDADHPVTHAQRMWDRTPQHIRERLVLGFTYLTFQAWLASPGVMPLHRRPLDRHGLARWSYDRVAEVLESTTEDESTPYDWLLNHVVYVGVMAGIDDPKLPGYAQELRRRTTDRSAPYRFTDTLAYFSYLTALRALPPDGEDTDGWRDRYCGELVAARDEVRRVIEDIPDDVVRGHWREIRNFASRMGCG